MTMHIDVFRSVRDKMADRIRNERQFIDWDPGVVGRILRQLTARLNMWDEIVLF
jgi:hypothetical protein